MTWKGRRYSVWFKLLLVVCLCSFGVHYVRDYLPISILLQKDGFTFKPLTETVTTTTVTPAPTTAVVSSTTSTTATTTPTTVAVRGTSTSASGLIGSTPEGSDRISEAYPRQYHFVLNEPDVCQRQRPFLVLMVPVHPGNARAREVIRMTWGNETLVQGKVVSTLFLLGRPYENKDQIQEKVVNESAKYRDMVQSDFVDSYFNLTIKTMVIMDWVATYCPGASYAMKIDSDMFLNVENLMKLLLNPETPKENYATGMVMWDRPVVRSRDSKWYVSEEAYPDSTYPNYPLGMGYVFSIDLPEKLVRVSKGIRMFNIEDAFVGVCLKHLGISLSNPPDPSQFKAYGSGPFDRCEYLRVITTILGSADQLLLFWRGYKADEPPC